MANKNSINFGTIFKRSSCLNAVSEEKVLNSEKRFQNLKTQLEAISDKDGQEVSPSIKSSLKSFLESICNNVNADQFYYHPLYLMQEFNRLDSNIANQILSEYTSRIMPYIANLTYLPESVERYDITDKQKQTILEFADKYIIVDRILNNHDKISKRFNINQEIQKVPSKGLKYVVESCCSMIDTYRITPYAKMNLCLEEIGYLLDKNGIIYESDKFVKYVTEYFLLRNTNLSLKDLKGYRTVLQENCYIGEDDTQLVQYALDPDFQYSSRTSISKEIEKFLMSQEKSVGLLEEMMRNCLLETDLNDLKNNIDKIYLLFWDIIKFNLFDNLLMTDASIILFNRILSKLHEESDKLSQEYIQILVQKTDKVEKSIIISSDNDNEYNRYAQRYKNILKNMTEKLQNMSNLVYTQSNLEAIRNTVHIRANLESSQFTNSNDKIISLNEFKIFKFHNLIRAGINLDKYLRAKAKVFFNKQNTKAKKFVKKVKNILFGESTNIYSCFNEEGQIDICVAQYEFDSSSISEIHNFLNEVCKEFNSTLTCENSTLSCYYQIIANELAEVHIKDSVLIELTEEDKKICNETYDESFDLYLENLSYSEYCFNILEKCGETEFNLENIQTYLQNPDVELSLESYKILIEALSFLNVEKDQINLLSESFENHRYRNIIIEEGADDTFNLECKEISKITDSWEKVEDVPLHIQAEAYQIMTSILEAAPKVKKPKVGVEKDDPNTKVDESRDNPLKGINLNSMKLYLAGLKSKVKEMSSKEKEISRNLDNNFRRLVKSFKDAMISDRREAIIKGSVIPSFSKCIKISIALAAIGVISGNPLVPLGIAIAGFATSKKLTQRERVLLLDEIETELEVLEKEISLAESRNQLKKYRTLLKYKKDLQRQYQRIRYNIRVGKDILPNSTAGMKDFSNTN